ncbi:hypothetical protein BKP64_07560 [Marinobacter salinus]|uniref:Uracil-DNA glycosylase-like domain-containing protein n=1 Tax=Marinobacter salinus TaxID=1874317 RepID=A0A1D9GK69_9GAMM|nr:uracil-DNA glycosylase [Marinobacter salinus]AOY88038.1 hypothetical protein BKP64_07560 [Marinobacter salinus]
MNLRLYFQYMNAFPSTKKILLVGEAPGHKGCGVTGIPFTSGAAFQDGQHPLLQQLNSQISLPYVESENTATIVWEYLYAKENTPLFWNSFPFHPHPESTQATNRAPTNDEIDEGVRYLREIREWYRPDVVASVGWKGMRGLSKAFPGENFLYIRHPSFGGKRDFISGMENVI